MTNGGLGPHNEIVDPLVVKPDPLKECDEDWIRANLHRVADAAKAIDGHYRFFAYTDARSVLQPAEITSLQNARGVGFGNSAHGLLKSHLGAAQSLSDPLVRLEGKGPFTQDSDIESCDVGGDVDFRTRGGIYLYSETIFRNGAPTGRQLVVSILLQRGLPDRGRGGCARDRCGFRRCESDLQYLRV
jgi:hypothetical protein